MGEWMTVAAALKMGGRQLKHHFEDAEDEAIIIAFEVKDTASFIIKHVHGVVTKHDETAQSAVEEGEVRRNAEEEASRSFLLARRIIEIVIALQLPEDYLHLASTLSRLLLSECQYLLENASSTSSMKSLHVPQLKLIVLGDANKSFGSCCFDESSSKRLDASLLVHFGECCFTAPTTSLPTYVVHGKASLNVDKLTDEIRSLCNLNKDEEPQTFDSSVKVCPEDSVSNDETNDETGACGRQQCASFGKGRRQVLLLYSLFHHYQIHKQVVSNLCQRGINIYICDEENMNGEFMTKSNHCWEKDATNVRGIKRIEHADVIVANVCDNIIEPLQSTDDAKDETIGNHQHGSSIGPFAESTELLRYRIAGLCFQLPRNWNGDIVFVGDTATASFRAIQTLICPFVIHVFLAPFSPENNVESTAGNVNPNSGLICSNSDSIMKSFIRRRYYILHQASSASIVGLLLATSQSCKWLLDAHRRIKRLLTDAKVRTYTVHVGYPTPEKLANFPEVQCWVAFTCSLCPILNIRDYMCPVISAQEALVAFSSKLKSMKYDLDVDTQLGTLWKPGFTPSYTCILFQSNDFEEGRGAVPGNDPLNLYDSAIDFSGSPNEMVDTNEIRAITAQSANHEIVSSNGVVISAADYFDKRSFKGLRLEDDSVRKDKASAIYEGQSGRSVQYNTDH